MKRYNLYKRYLLIAAALCGLGTGLAFLQACAGAASPPVSIPAPVAGLVSITSPDSSGMVQLAGDQAAAVDGATINVLNNATQGFNLLAQTTPVASTQATSSGSFQTSFPAQVGDSFLIEQVIGGEANEDGGILVTVVDGRTLVDATPVGATTSFGASLGCTLQVFSDGSDVDCYSLSTFTPQPDLNVTGVLPVDLALDRSTQDTYLIDQANNFYFVVDAMGIAKGASVAVTAPVAIAADPTGLVGAEFALIAQDTGASSVTMVDNSLMFPATGTTFLVSHPSNGAAVHVGTYAIAGASDGSSLPRFVVLSLFDNGDTILTELIVSAPPSNIISLGSQVNLGAGDFAGLAFFNSATEVALIDRSNNRLVRLSGLGLITQTTVDLSATGDYRNVAIASGSAALVTDFANNQVVIVNLMDNSISQTLTTSDGVGLGPNAISINDSPLVAIITNEKDSSVSLIDLTEILSNFF